MYQENPALIPSIQIRKKLTVNRNIASILYSLSQEATRLLNADRATIYLYD